MPRWILALGLVLAGIGTHVRAGEDEVPDPARPAAVFEHLDRNNDGKLTVGELPDFLRSAFPRMDSDGDGAVSAAEYSRFSAGKSAAPKAEAHRVHSFLRDRHREHGRRNLRANGGGKQTEAAVELGLSWLARHQEKTGEWSETAWKDRRETEKCSGIASGEYDVVSTSLALLAFLGAGDTELKGKRRTIVKSGLDWLASRQAESGRIGPGAERLYYYDHAVATLAMSEAYAMTGDPARGKSAERAYRYLLAARRPGEGWGAGPRAEREDAGVTLWSLLAVRSAMMAGLTTPPKTLAEIRKRVAGWTVAKPAEGAPLFPHSQWQMGTGLLFFREGFRHDWGAFRKDPDVLSLVAAVPKERTAGDWYLGTMGLFMLHGDPYKWWNLAMYEILLPRQAKKGCAAGSYDPADFGEKRLGRVGVTACLTMCLEVYYRYGYCY